MNVVSNVDMDVHKKVKFRIILFTAILFFALFGWAKSSMAANHYVIQSDTGSKNGSDWNNAYASLPATLARGDTYYVAGGSYGSYVFANNSGTSVITVKKATAADHGTATGWNDNYASGQAVWTGWDFRMSNLVIDGQTGGGPGSWDTGHGIAVRALADHLIYQGFSDPSISNVVLRHVELDGTSTTPADRDIVYLVSGATDLTMQYMYIHDVGSDTMQLRNNITRFTLEFSKIARNNQNDSFHGDVFEYDGGTASGWIHRYNWFDDCQGTYLWGTHETGTFANAEIYGNIISGGQMDNGMIAGLSGGGTITGLKFYNNTISQVSMSAGFLYLERGSNNLVYNNLWYNSPANLQGTHDYNWFRGSGAQSEAHIQNGSGDPFVNIAADNYNLAAATSAGTTLNAPYNADMTGKVRGADGVWDRGALEYGTGSGGDTTPPSAPSGLSVS